MELLLELLLLEWNPRRFKVSFRNESTEEKIARIDENVEHLLDALPMIQRHDRELFALKLIIGIVAPLFTFWLANKLGIQIF